MKKLSLLIALCLSLFLCSFCVADAAGDSRSVSMLEQRHYSGEWDVLRPASEIVDMNVFSRAMLEELKAEAEKIIEGWEVTDVGA